MAQLRLFEENDFYSDNDSDEDFTKYMSDADEDEDEDEVEIPLEKADVVELSDDDESPPEDPKQDQQHDSVLDSLLGEALFGEQINPRVEGLFDDLNGESDDEPEQIERNQLEDVDSGIGPSPSVSASTEIEIVEELTARSEEPSSVFDMSSISNFLEYMKEEEHAVHIDEIPDFASKKNVYGTSFNVRTGAISRPPRFEFTRRDTRWIDSCKKITYDNGKPLEEMLTLGKHVSSVKLGAKIDLSTFQYTDVHCRTAKEMEEMETHNIQEIIQEAFNTRRLAVLLLGVEKNGKVMGCKLNPGKQDNLRLALDTAVQTEFVPPVENVLDAIDIQFLPVEDVKDTFLIVIRVKQLRNQFYRLESSV